MRDVASRRHSTHSLRLCSLGGPPPSPPAPAVCPPVGASPWWGFPSLGMRVKPSFLPPRILGFASVRPHHTPPGFSSGRERPRKHLSPGFSEACGASPPSPGRQHPGPEPLSWAPALPASAAPPFPGFRSAAGLMASLCCGFLSPVPACF